MTKMTLSTERARRGLPEYAAPERASTRRLTRGQTLGDARRAVLRTMMERMVSRDPEVRNSEIAEAFRAATGVSVSVWTVWYHRTHMGLPNAPRGPRVKS